jgi:hypothetical protein
MQIPLRIFQKFIYSSIPAFQEKGKPQTVLFMAAACKKEGSQPI